MQPIRGPIDYNRYPRRSRRRMSRRADANETSQADSSTSSTEENTFADTAPPASPARSSLRRGATPARRSRRSRYISEDETTEDGVAPVETATPLLPSRRRRTSKSPIVSTRPRVPLWKRARRWCAILLCVLCVEAVFALLTAPQFAIERVEVEGLNITSPDAAQAISASLQGQNWLRARLQKAARQLEALPTVRTARVTRNLTWPPQVTIRVQEREAFARVGAGDDWWVVDESGVAFRRADTQNTEDEALYAVTGPTLQPQLGEALPPKSWQPVREFALSLAQEQQNGTRWSLRRLYFDRHGYASLRITGGPHNEMLIQLGSDKWPQKLQRARQALAYFEATGRRAAVLNLISYAMPTWTPQREIATPKTDERAPQSTEEPDNVGTDERVDA